MLSLPQKHLNDIKVHTTTGPRAAADHSRPSTASGRMSHRTHSNGGRQWGHAPCQHFQSLPTQIPTELNTQAMYAAPNAAVCFWHVSTYRAFSREPEPLTALRDVLGAPATCLALCSVLRLQTESGRVLVPELLTHNLVPIDCSEGCAELS